VGVGGAWSKQEAVGCADRCKGFAVTIVNREE
jgi:hypothetical protein